jgi:hypothetical protein
LAYKGFFKPKFPAKYKGNPTTIIYRSSWELKFMAWLDIHPDVIQWSSEEFCIPYRSPIDGRIHRYFPDFYVKKKDSNGNTEVLVVEIKPAYQTVAPERKSKKNKTYIREVVEWGKNEAKWKAAEEFCADRSWKFVKMTERELGIKH